LSETKPLFIDYDMKLLLKTDGTYEFRSLMGNRLCPPYSLNIVGHNYNLIGYNTVSADENIQAELFFRDPKRLPLPFGDKPKLIGESHRIQNESNFQIPISRVPLAEGESPILKVIKNRYKPELDMEIDPNEQAIVVHKHQGLNYEPVTVDMTGIKPFDEHLKENKKDKDS
jgi:hypothetical protein